jgi:serine/threonine-protein kinase
VARFFQEARAAAEVSSEHVVRIIDVGALDDGSPFIVMEYLRGSDMARLVRTRGPLSVVNVAGYLVQACEAVAEAHARGIVHRDLKPANLFLTTHADGSPLVKVLDFGVSKLTRRGDFPGGSLTKSRSVVGTPLYMSPEQLRSALSVGPASDIWSLGCIAYELLAGRPAFQAESAAALGALIAAGPTPRIRDVRPDVPAEIETIIARCLEKDPAERYASVGDFAKALGAFAPPDMAPLVGRVTRISARPTLELEALPTSLGASLESPARLGVTGGALTRSRTEETRRGRMFRPVWVAWAVAVISAASVLGSVVLGHSSPTPTGTPAVRAPSAANPTSAPPSSSLTPSPSAPSSAPSAATPPAFASTTKKPPSARGRSVPGTSIPRPSTSVPADRDAIE